MRFSLMVVISLCILSLCAQGVRTVSGEWVGTSYVGATPYNVELNLEQVGNQLTGYSITRSMNGRDSIKMTVNGNVDGDQVLLFGVEIVYKTRVTCISNVELVYASGSDQERLEGRWKGDWSIRTCAPGLSGKMKLYRPLSQMHDADERGFKPTKPNVGTPDELASLMIKTLDQRKYYALLIGINAYAHESIVSLDNPLKDVDRLAEVLLDQYLFREENVSILKDPGRAEIIDALDALSKKVTDKDNLLIFYAGHGIWDERLKQGYWLPADASADSKSYWLSNSTIRDYLGGIQSKHTLLISDACFSGGILKERGVTIEGRAMLELYKMPSRKAMTSGTMTTVPDESVFMEYLIKNLKENEQPLLSSEDLFRNFRIAVINNSPNGQVPQYGAISQVGDEGGDFIFLKKQ